MSLVCLRALVLFVSCAFAAAKVTISKVEPPGWWASHSINPVRLLITGRDLTPRVSSNSPLVTPGPVKLSADKRYGFLDLTISPRTEPGRYTLTIGGTAVPFEVYKPLPRTGRFSGFSPDDVIYLIMPDRFANGDAANDGPLTDRRNARMYHGGDLKGIIQRLPYLKDLGVTTIWITPVADNSNEGRSSSRGASADYHGYHAVDLYKVEEQFGDIGTFRELVDAAHRTGMKIMQDQVVNHVGPEHPWVDAPPTSTWLHGTRSSHLRSSPDMWSLVDPYASPALRRGLLEGWFVDRLPDLNQDDSEVERYLIQNTLWWIGMTGIDAIRADTMPFVPKRFWHAWMRAIRREYPHFEVVGEVYNRDPVVIVHFQDVGARLFDFPVHEILRTVFIAGEDLTKIPAALVHDTKYFDANRLVTFIGSHDIPRFRERGAHDALKAAFLYLLTGRGTPMIYYGDEIGMKGAGDPENRRDFPGGWSGDSRNAFSPAGRTPEEQDMFAHVQRLLTLRLQRKALRRGRLTNLSANRDSYVYARYLAGEATVIVALGKPARMEIGKLFWPGAISVITDALGTNSLARREGGFVEITGPGVFVIPAPTRAGQHPVK